MISSPAMAVTIVLYGGDGDDIYLRRIVQLLGISPSYTITGNQLDGGAGNDTLIGTRRRRLRCSEAPVRRQHLRQRFRQRHPLWRAAQRSRHLLLRIGNHGVRHHLRLRRRHRHPAILSVDRHQHRRFPDLGRGRRRHRRVDRTDLHRPDHPDRHGRIGRRNRLRFRVRLGETASGHPTAPLLSSRGAERRGDRETSSR